MSEVSIHNNANSQQLIATAVTDFYLTVETLALEQAEIFVALSGGRSVAQFYAELNRTSSSLLQNYWGKIRFCLADERLTGPTNFSELQEQLFDKLLAKGLITTDQLLPFTTQPGDGSTAALLNSYNSKIKRVDVVVLGVGEDGHTCSLFPNHQSVLAEEEGYIKVADAPKPPAARISMSKTLLSNCQYSFAFFISPAKQLAWERFNDESLSSNEVPIKLATTVSKKAFVYTDIMEMPIA